MTDESTHADTAPRHNPESLKKIVEAAMLAAGRPLTINQLIELFGDGERPEINAIKEALAAISVDCEERGWELRQVASGYRFQVRDELAPWISRLWEERPQRYSRALMETLALIAYRQPITRGDIEDIRGVAVSSNIIRTLRERDWIRVVGHKEVPGRPAMYATTRSFLDYFGLKSLEQLPSLPDIKDLDSLNRELELEMAPGPVEGQPDGEATVVEAGEAAELETLANLAGSAAGDAVQSAAEEGEDGLAAEAVLAAENSEAIKSDADTGFSDDDTVAQAGDGDNMAEASSAQETTPDEDAALNTAHDSPETERR